MTLAWAGVTKRCRPFCTPLIRRVLGTGQPPFDDLTRSGLKTPLTLLVMRCMRSVA